MIAVREDAQGFSENHHAASEGGRMAGDARANFEKNMNESVLSSQNYLNLNDGDKPDELPDKECPLSILSIFNLFLILK
jgi:hypothetical protein